MRACSRLQVGKREQLSLGPWGRSQEGNTGLGRGTVSRRTGVCACTRGRTLTHIYPTAHHSIRGRPQGPLRRVSRLQVLGLIAEGGGFSPGYSLTSQLSPEPEVRAGFLEGVTAGVHVIQPCRMGWEWRRAGGKLHTKRTEPQRNSVCSESRAAKVTREQREEGALAFRPRSLGLVWKVAGNCTRSVESWGVVPSLPRAPEPAAGEGA